MDQLEFEELLNLIQNSDESERVEVKRAAEKIGDSALETISAFSNEPGLGGGYLVLGLTKNDSNKAPRYKVTRVSNPDKLQSELVTLCRQNFNKPIRPAIDVLLHPQGPIIVAYISEAETYEKPIFIKSRGIEKGAYRRIGPTDQLCTQEDLDMLYQLRSQKKFDKTVLEEASWKDFDPQAIAAYRVYRKEVNAKAKELVWNDQELMIALRAAVEVKNVIKPTVAGIILFGTEMALRRLFPISSRIDYITVEGREWVPHPEKRYSQCYEFGEALVLAIPRVIANIMRDIPHAFSMQPNNIFRKDIPLIPDVVIREAVCNSVMHRDYRAGQTIQIILYANRIEFLNPGYSLKPEDQLGLPGSITRNDQIAEVLHDLQIAEVKGTGIRTMREAMREANLSVPFFESDRTANKFTLTLLTHHFFDEKDIEWLKNFKEFDLTDEEARTLIVVREMGAITNADYRNINCVETLTASASLRRLRDLGLLEQKGRSNATYYVPTNKLLTGHIKPNLQSSNLPSLDSNLPSLSSNLPSSAGQVVSSLFASIPEDLKSKIENLRKKSDIEEVKSLIKDLCSLRPFRIQELSEILKRNPKYIKEVYLKSMIESGILEYTFPHQSSHPQQAYRTKK